MPSITIGPEFFKKAINDYADWNWALVREFFQNCIDCGSKNITFDAKEVDGKTIVTVTNDGEPMTEDILVNKLLSLGSSGKSFANGAVGGFGKAKELLYFCWDNYSIRTGSLHVKGSGAEYELKKVRRSFNGTESIITIDGCHAANLINEAKNFITFSQAKQRITINDKEITTRTKCGYFRRSLNCGKVYTNRQWSHQLIVRMNGTPMFTGYTQYDQCIVIELAGVSGDVLTSNRDGLRLVHRTELNAFTEDLTTNKRKALQQPTTEVIKFDGAKVCCKGKLVAALNEISQPTISALTNGGDTTIEDGGSYNALSTSFIIRNETGRKLPASWRPDNERFSQYAYKLATLWARVLVTIHKVFDIEAEFSIGFVFNEDCIALHESGPNGCVYYINPIVISGRRWSKRWKCSTGSRNRKMLNQLAISALHEVVHGLGYSSHNEAYSSKLTEMAGTLLCHTTELRQSFSGRTRKSKRGKK